MPDSSVDDGLQIWEIECGNPLMFTSHWMHVHPPLSDIPTAVELVAWNDGLMVGQNASTPSMSIIGITWKAIAIANCQTLIYVSQKKMHVVLKNNRFNLTPELI